MAREILTACNKEGADRVTCILVKLLHIYNTTTTIRKPVQTFVKSLFKFFPQNIITKVYTYVHNPASPPNSRNLELDYRCFVMSDEEHCGFVEFQDIPWQYLKRATDDRQKPATKSQIIAFVRVNYHVWEHVEKERGGLRAEDILLLMELINAI